MFTHRSRTRSYRRPQTSTSSPFRYRLHCEALELRAVPASLLGADAASGGFTLTSGPSLSKEGTLTIVSFAPETIRHASSSGEVPVAVYVSRSSSALTV